MLNPSREREEEEGEEELGEDVDKAGDGEGTEVGINQRKNRDEFSTEINSFHFAISIKQNKIMNEMATVITFLS